MYFRAMLLFLGVWLLLWLVRARSRQLSLLSGILTVPFAVLGYIFVPAYWLPDHHVQLFRGVGIEDFLFCFVSGGLVGTLIRVPHENCCKLFPDKILWRYFFWSTISLSLVFGAVAVGYHSLYACIGSFILCTLFCYWQRPQSIAPLLRTGVEFCLLYTTFSIVYLNFTPHAGRFWQESAISGTRCLGLPVEESLWAFSFGTTWPVIVTYLLHGKQDRNTITESD